METHHNFFFLTTAICSLYMTGVIWIIQLIHYPSFKLIAPNLFDSFHLKHSQVMTVAVGPIMVVELLSVLIWIYSKPDQGFPLRLIAGLVLGLTIICWLATFLLSVPVHNQLAQGFDLQKIDRLVRENWIRTIAWTLKSCLAVTLLYLS